MRSEAVYLLQGLLLVGTILGMGRRRRPAFWELAVLAIYLAYLTPLVVVGNVATYGTRMLAPGIPLLLLLAVRGIDELLRRTEGLPALALQPGSAG